MTPKPFPDTGSGRLVLPALLASALLIGGCASSPEAPTGPLERAGSAVGIAEQNDAGRYAATELAAARQKLDEADMAVKEGRMAAAQRLAIEARIEAELAYARTEAAKAAAINAEMKRGAEALTEEMNRTGAQQ